MEMRTLAKSQAATHTRRTTGSPSPAPRRPTKTHKPRGRNLVLTRWRWAIERASGVHDCASAACALFPVWLPPPRSFPSSPARLLILARGAIAHLAAAPGRGGEGGLRHVEDAAGEREYARGSVSCCALSDRVLDGLADAHTNAPPSPPKLPAALRRQSKVHMGCQRLKAVGEQVSGSSMARRPAGVSLLFCQSLASLRRRRR
ncbi:hypothetical protein EDB80DRAFT_680785 [Ilyonectria destructans]|nr:hypothetical protein EDB80DRAFT_680785 [Ilyonectria destructans]